MKAKFIRGQNPKNSLGIGIAKEVEEILQSTSKGLGGAYSFTYYGLDNWSDIIYWLLSSGYNKEEADMVLRSKIMRWTADKAEKVEANVTLEDFHSFNNERVHGKTSVDDFLDTYLPDPSRTSRIKQLKEEAVGGVSAPMTTVHNTPGVGNATPAATASTGETSGSATIGSGDRWDNTTTKKKKKKKKKVNESLGYVRYDGDRYEILDDDPDHNRIFLKPLRSPYGGGYHSSPMSKPSFWVSKDSPDLEYLDQSVNETNINPHDKLGVAMAQKMGVRLPFRKGKGGKDVEQIQVDEDIDLSTELVTFEEWAKKFVNH